MRKSERIALIFVGIVIFAAALALAQTQAQPPTATPAQAPVLPTARDQFGGRPGSFHFITNEQAMADAAELQKALAAIESLDAKLAASDHTTRDRLSPEVQAVRTYVLTLQAQQTRSAGDTARMVEANLNASKGKFMCGTCHRGDMSMMNGRGGMGMKRGAGAGMMPGGCMAR
jgi:hypothetical protein